MLARAAVTATPGSRLTLDAALAERPRAISFVSAACRAAGLTIDDEHAVISAFGEAFNNVVLHSYGGGGGLVDVDIELRRDHLVVSVRDTGAGFDPARVRAPQLDALPEGGLGVFIILRAMDEVSWYREGVENVVTMTKRLRAR
jgi:serine/threonine-protein kinase RsbW